MQFRALSNQLTALPLPEVRDAQVELALVDEAAILKSVILRTNLGRVGKLACACNPGNAGVCLPQRRRRALGRSCSKEAGAVLGHLVTCRPVSAGWTILSGVWQR